MVGVDGNERGGEQAAGETESPALEENSLHSAVAAAAAEGKDQTVCDSAYHNRTAMTWDPGS